MARSHTAVHPGHVLQKDFMQLRGVTRERLAKEIEMPLAQVDEILNGQRPIAADTAARLGKLFGTTEMFWLNLQARYGLDVQRQEFDAGLASVKKVPQHRDSGPGFAKFQRSFAAAAKRGAVRSAFRRRAK
jgi:antitoxin HigA-1